MAERTRTFKRSDKSQRAGTFSSVFVVNEYGLHSPQCRCSG